MNDTADTVSEGIEEKLDESFVKIMSESEISGDLITPDKLYVDLAMLKDLYIGTMLSFLIVPYSDALPKLRGDEGYRYLMSQIAKYRKRDFNDMEFYFPDFGITTEMVHERMYDPKYSDLVFSSSPASSFLRTLWAQLAINVNHSTVAKKKDPIVLTINTFPLKLSTENTDLLGAFIVAQFGVNAAPIYVDPTVMSLAQFSSFEEYYIYHYKPFSDRGDIQELFTGLKMIKKWLFIPQYFGYKFNPLLNLKIAVRKDFSQLSAVIQFKYLSMDLVSVPAPEDKT